MAVIDTGTDDLRAEVDGGVAVLTFNRPERRNALSATMLEGLMGVLGRLEADDDVGCIVLTGSGEAFCAGGDVKSFARGEGAGGGSFEARYGRQRASHRATSLRIWEMQKPSIAAIRGAAAGAGLSLALACDLRYSTPSAVLTTAFGRVGLSGDYGGTWFLTRLVGTAKARELYYLSERIDAAEADRLGMVNAVFPEEVFTDEVMSRARRIADGPRVALRFMKDNLTRAVLGSLPECLDTEAEHHIRTFETPDHKEAARAFVEKREPKFGAGEQVL